MRDKTFIVQSCAEKTDGIVYGLLYYIPELLILVFTCNQLRNKQ
jgi:hypothetical protein